ncbi:phosphonates transport ATP-binding protein PhnL [Escherichia coli]|uniref:Phosphonates transport ATP-binding protein PhnL n=1 Tax=Escherichia coli TaxID=562 RepID=A0A377A7U0_ECOLX|nr:phosphonates transport ATP-binding protein PhnL [Escherichia coli]
MAPGTIDIFRWRTAARQHRRGFIVDYPILLLDEPTASLDAKNSAAVVELIREAKTRGAAIVGIFHDEAVRNDVADRLHPMGASS